MARPIRIGIAGYGNLGRGVEIAVAGNPDMELVGIFSRRPPEELEPARAGSKVYHMNSLLQYADIIDVLVLCGGSKTDLPRQSPDLAARFNIVDSFDTHARIPEHFAAVDAAAKSARKTALISAGWDPGLFSINRLMGEALVPDGETYTFWGDGLSQGHSDAVRRVEGVAAGVQYTRPIAKAVEQVRSSERPALSTADKHRRECFVVLEEGADPEEVREAIQTMPHYFADYETDVHFITAEELARDHQGMGHGGFVIRSGNTSPEQAQVVEYGLKLGSNPEFTASVLVAYARAVYRMRQLGQYGAKTVFDVPPALISPRSPEELRAELL